VSKKKVTKKGTLKSYIHSYNFTGVLTGMLFVYLSFGPSLLPRAWFMQAVISAVLFVFGYGIGVFISYIVRQFTFTEPSADAKRKIKTVAVVVFALAYVIASWLGYIWQQNSHQLMNIDTPASYSIRLLLRSPFIRSIDGARRHHRLLKSYSAVLRNEQLSEDLIALIEANRGRCRFADNAAETIMRMDKRPRNASGRDLPSHRDYYDDETRGLVAKRDRFFIDEFNYAF